MSETTTKKKNVWSLVLKIIVTVATALAGVFGVASWCVWCSVVHVVMRTITLIILHCSATREGQSFGFEDCRRDHIRHRGFRDIGYHYYITRDGTVHRGRPLEQVGAHCRNHNRHSIGICYEGGLDAEGRAKDTRTEAQKCKGHADGGAEGQSVGPGRGAEGAVSAGAGRRPSGAGPGEGVPLF